jgi:acyl-CoA reductase-like NAD-dependent aldehyde dehydrogenase
VGVIGPWNVPLVNSFGDCIPALAAGNSVVLKPSPVTPLTNVLCERMVRDCGMPADVFRVATGEGETGAALVGHVDFVHFTGSVETGRKVAHQAIDRMVPYSLELGGKDPMIVTRDANLERAANVAVHYGMANAGQVCISIERVYVEEPAYHEFVAKVKDKVASLRQGVPGAAGGTDLGAVIFPPQLEKVRRHVEEAKAAGADVYTPNPPADPRHFFPPTVLTGVDHSMTCMRDETFGPTLPIMKVADTEEAIRLANDTSYGLGAYVFAGSTRDGEAIARRIDAGSVAVNDAWMNYFSLEAPMGGWKESGFGSRHGAYGIRKYCKQKTVLVARAALDREPHMMPFRASWTKGMDRLIKLLYQRRSRR